MNFILNVTTIFLIRYNKNSLKLLQFLNNYKIYSHLYKLGLAIYKFYL